MAPSSTKNVLRDNPNGNTADLHVHTTLGVRGGACGASPRAELELVVAEKKDTLLGTGLPMPMIAGKSDALVDEVVVVISQVVGIYSAAETEGTLCILWLLQL